jgi:hypothetical protein
MNAIEVRELTDADLDAVSGGMPRSGDGYTWATNTT